MTIEPYLVYDSITLYLDDKEDPIWTIKGPLSGDLLAGLIAGLELMLDDMFVNFNGPYGDGMARIVPQNTGKIDVYFSSYDDMMNILHNYVDRQNRQVRIDDINKAYAYVGIHGPDFYCWWIKNILTPKIHTLYLFKSSDFVQGFITICSAFKVDYRDYVLGKPYKYLTPQTPATIYNIEE